MLDDINNNDSEDAVRLPSGYPTIIDAIFKKLVLPHLRGVSDGTTLETDLKNHFDNLQQNTTNQISAAEWPRIKTTIRNATCDAVTHIFHLLDKDSGMHGSSKLRLNKSDKVLTGPEGEFWGHFLPLRWCMDSKHEEIAKFRRSKPVKKKYDQIRYTMRSIAPMINIQELHHVNYNNTTIDQFLHRCKTLNLFTDFATDFKTMLGAPFPLIGLPRTSLIFHHCH